MTTGTALPFQTTLVFIFGGRCPDWMGKGAPQRYHKVVRRKDENKNRN